jgi:hypothetical protein
LKYKYFLVMTDLPMLSTFFAYPPHFLRAQPRSHCHLSLNLHTHRHHQNLQHHLIYQHCLKKQALVSVHVPPQFKISYINNYMFLFFLRFDFKCCVLTSMSHCTSQTQFSNVVSIDLSLHLALAEVFY